MAQASPDHVLEKSLASVLDELSRTEVNVAGGSAAALSAAFAASLTTMVARASRPAWPDAGGTIAQAQALRARLCQLVATDARAYGRARSLLLRAEQDREHHGVAVAPHGAAPVSREERDRELAEALSQAAEVPVALAEAAADVAAISAWTAAEGNADHRADAVIATLLAAAAAQAAAHLVQINLAARPGDEQLKRAEAAARAALADRDRVLG